MKNFTPNPIYTFILLAIVIGFSSCMTVPSLVTSEQYKSQYVDQPLKLLIDDYGLPTNSEELEDGTKVSTWEMGTETSSVSVYYGYGIASGTSNQQAKRMTAYANSEGIVTDLRSSGYEMGNKKEVDAAKATNTYLGIIYGSGIVSLLILLSL
jgi:hypothetical protein